jgi:hypothetical protein
VKAEREFGLEQLLKETLAAYRTAGWADENAALERRRQIEAVRTSTN